MTTEQLLQPRYEVIADYPDSRKNVIGIFRKNVRIVRGGGIVEGGDTRFIRRTSRC